MLHTIDPVRFVDTWLNLTPQDQRYLIGGFDKRYSGKPKLIPDEKPWWENVKKQLKSRLESEEFKPRQIQLQSLIDEVAKLISGMEEQLKGSIQSLGGTSI